MLVKKTDFDAKLRNLNNKATANITKQIDAYKKLTDNITSYAKLTNDL